MFARTALSLYMLDCISWWQCIFVSVLSEVLKLQLQLALVHCSDSLTVDPLTASRLCLYRYMSYADAEGMKDTFYLFPLRDVAYVGATLPPMKKRDMRW